MTAPVLRDECGTYAGRQTHTRMGEQPCRACIQAATRYAAHHRFRTGQQHHPVICRHCGSVFPDHRCGGMLTSTHDEGTS